MLGDELELIEGDYVFMTPGQSSPDGWYSGTSWLTGNTGMFPAVFTQRTSETWIWTLHRSVDIGLFPRLPGFGVLVLVEGLNSVFFFKNRSETSNSGFGTYRWRKGKLKVDQK